MAAYPSGPGREIQILDTRRMAVDGFRTFKICVVSGAVGILLGVPVTFGMMQLNGYELTKSASPASGPSAQPGKDAAMMGGENCPMKNGAGIPRPQRDLTTVVQKLDLLTGGITLSAAQAAKVKDCLKDIEKSDCILDGEAKARQEQLLAVLNKEQQERLDTIEIPRPATEGCPMAAAQRDKTQNPFQREDEAKTLKSLRERLASKGTATAADTPKVPAVKTESSKTSSPKK